MTKDRRPRPPLSLRLACVDTIQVRFTLRVRCRRYAGSVELTIYCTLSLHCRRVAVDDGFQVRLVVEIDVSREVELRRQGVGVEGGGGFCRRIVGCYGRRYRIAASRRYADRAPVCADLTQVAFGVGGLLVGFGGGQCFVGLIPSLGHAPDQPAVGLERVRRGQAFKFANQVVAGVLNVGQFSGRKNQHHRKNNQQPRHELVFGAVPACIRARPSARDRRPCFRQDRLLKLDDLCLEVDQKPRPIGSRGIGRLQRAVSRLQFRARSSGDPKVADQAFRVNEEVSGIGIIRFCVGHCRDPDEPSGQKHVVPGGPGGSAQQIMLGVTHFVPD